MSDYYSKYLDIIHSEKNKYKGAGFIFYEKNGNDLHFLLGLSNQNKNKQTLSVFGGAREKKDINPLYTAIRETFEELFNIVPPGLDLFLIQIQNKVDDYSIIEKIFVKSSNEICYIANINILNLFLEHLIYQNAEWTFKGKHSWNKYNNKINLFINDRILKNNQKINNGINEVRKIFLISWNIINDNIKNEKPIIINKKEYYLKDNLSKYLQDNIIIDIINKNII